MGSHFLLRFLGSCAGSVGDFQNSLTGLRIRSGASLDVDFRALGVRLPVNSTGQLSVLSRVIQKQFLHLEGNTKPLKMLSAER